MMVRILFYCPHCGSLLYRPSQTRGWKDTLLRAFGVLPQRCQMCRLRFYLFRLKNNRLRLHQELLSRRESSNNAPAVACTAPLQTMAAPK
jgi:hypothetical protein